MDEKRGESRPGALIIFSNGTKIIDCSMRNRSEHGAQLKGLSIVGIPDRFELHETATHERHASRYLAQDRAVGLTFEAK